MSCFLLPQLRNGCRSMEHHGACSGGTWHPSLPSTRTEPLHLVTNILLSAELAVQPPSCTRPSVQCSQPGNLPDKKVQHAHTLPPSPLLSCVYKYPKPLSCWLSCLELHILSAAESTATKGASKRANPRGGKPQLTGHTQGTGTLQEHSLTSPNPHPARTAICFL